MEHKSFPFEVKLVDPNLGAFEGFASVYGVVDYDDDVVVKGAFADSLSKSGGKIPILWQHDTKHCLGLNQSFDDNDHGLLVKGQLTMEVHKAAECRALMRDGAITGLSIGYIVLDGGSYRKNGIRYITKADLLEYSAVTFPACAQALITAVKSCVPYQSLALASADRGFDPGAAKGRIKAWADGDFRKYKKAFLHCDEDKPEDFASYRFPIADIVDGEIKVVAKAVIAAHADLKSNTTIPDAEKSAMQKHVERYSKKFGFNLEHKGATMDKKTLDFNQTLAAEKAKSAHWQERRDIEHAHEASMKALHAADVTLPQKKEMCAKACDQYNEAKKAWHMKNLEMASDPDNYGEMSYSEYGMGYKFAGMPEYETKSGRAISKVNAAHLDDVTLKLADAVTLLKNAHDCVLGVQGDVKMLAAVGQLVGGMPVAPGNEAAPNPGATTEGDVKNMFSGFRKNLFDDAA